MGNKYLSTEEFIRYWTEAKGDIRKVAELTKMTERGVYKRRKSIAQQGEYLTTNYSRVFRSKVFQNAQRASRLEVDIQNGSAIIFSDAHYWPGIISVGHLALVKAIQDVQPQFIIANGDILDGATISRHDPDGWQNFPKLAQEIETVQERLKELQNAAPNAQRLWCLGNHDTRFERYLAMRAPAIKDVAGTTLPEHFGEWQFGMSFFINHGTECIPTVVKHRYANGIHATYNNTLRAGTHIVTGHLHRLNVTCWGDYRGRRYGVDTGTLADPLGPQFLYAEDNPSPAAQGFAVLTWKDGHMLPPELCEVRGAEAFFRGKSLL